MILVDSGPLIAAAIVQQSHHRACVDLFTGLGLAGRRLLVPHTVVAETAYMLHSYAGVRAESAFIRSLARQDFLGTEILPIDYARVVELIERYDDVPLGTTDASVIAVAERLGVREIATLDCRHFTAVRPSHVEASPSCPRRSGDPAVRKQSARRPAETNHRPTTPNAPVAAFRSSDRVFRGQSAMPNDSRNPACSS